MSHVRNLFKQSSHYLMGEVLITIAALVSFPILTRVFSQAEYGQMNLINIAISFVATIATGGMGMAIIRFFNEYQNQSLAQKRTFIFTVSVSSFLFGLTGSGIIAGCVAWGSFDVSLARILLYVSSIVMFRVCADSVFGFYRAAEKSFFFNLVKVVKKLLELVFVISIVLLVTNKIEGFYLAIFLTELVMIIFLSAHFFREFSFRVTKFSVEILAKVVKYGFPLMITNIAYLLGNFSDRYIIAYVLGPEKVGVYSVGYGMVSYLQALFSNGLNMALIPMATNIWINKGVDETKIFLSRIFNYFLLVSVPILFGFIAIRKEAIVVLASEKFLSASSVVPFMIASVIVIESYFFATAGLYMVKKTKKVASLVIVSAVINILLNCYLIPVWGIVGSALATLISNVIYVVWGAVISSKYLRLQYSFVSILKYFAVSTVMYYAIGLVRFNGVHILLVLGIKIVVGFLTYGILIYLFDAPARLSIRAGVSLVRCLLVRFLLVNGRKKE